MELFLWTARCADALFCLLVLVYVAAHPSKLGEAVRAMVGPRLAGIVQPLAYRWRLLDAPAPHQEPPTARDLEEREYPEFSQLLGGYFHQDFDLVADNLSGLVANYKSVTDEADVRGCVRDIHRFLERHGSNDETLRDELARVFNPGVIVEGWDGMTTREWLFKVAELLSEGTGDARPQPSIA